MPQQQAVDEDEVMQLKLLTPVDDVKLFTVVSSYFSDDLVSFVWSADDERVLNEGDVLLEVNSTNVLGLEEKRVLALLKAISGQKHVIVKVGRSNRIKLLYLELLARSTLKSSKWPALFSWTDMEPIERYEDYKMSYPFRVSSPLYYDMNTTSMTPFGDGGGSQVADQSRFKRHYLNSFLLEEVASDMDFSVGGGGAMRRVTSSPQSMAVYNGAQNRYGASPLTLDSGSAGYGTISPSSRVKIEKLEVALKCLDLDFNKSQLRQLRESLNIGVDGTVNYGEFVEKAMALLRKDKEEVVKPKEPPKPSESAELVKTKAKLEESMKECENLKKAMQNLKELLLDKEKMCSGMEDELINLRTANVGLENELHSLRSQLAANQEAEKKILSMEKDYNQVIELLEKEVADLKKSLEKEADNPIVKKRLTVLGCQIRKAEVGQRLYRTTTDKLLSFSRLCQASLLTDTKDVVSKRMTPREIGKEAKRVTEEVEQLLRKDKFELPFGWEEAYSENGDRYYINHLTQETQWERPTGGVPRRPSLSPLRPPPHSSAEEPPSLSMTYPPSTSQPQAAKRSENRSKQPSPWN